MEDKYVYLIIGIAIGFSVIDDLIKDYRPTFIYLICTGKSEEESRSLEET